MNQTLSKRILTLKLKLKDERFRFPRNCEAYAIGTYETRPDGRIGRFRVRRVVWGVLMARAEKRPGERIRRVLLLIKEKKEDGDKRLRRRGLQERRFDTATSI